MPIDYTGLPERFFQLFPGRTQKYIAETMYVGDEAQKKQVQISKWKSGKEPIPMDALAILVDKGLAEWNWLLTGKGTARGLTPAPSSSIRIIKGKKYAPPPIPVYTHAAGTHPACFPSMN